MEPFKNLILAIGAIALLVGCSPTASQLKDTIEKNPEILFNAIEKNPKKFLDVVNKAADSARQEMAKDRARQEEESLEEDFKSPKQAEIGPKRAIFGNKSAKVTIIEYSDFQCPYCARAAGTMDNLFKKYGDKVRLIYKHLPFKPMAEPAARYFEAIAIQDASKAKKFHDELYKNQMEIRKGGEDYLKKVTKKVGANLAKVLKDKDSKEVTDRIQSDTKEATKFGFNGTPGFIVGGVRVRGAYPMDHFVKIIDRHLNGGKAPEEKKN